jgi:hypothetical protein
MLTTLSFQVMTTRNNVKRIAGPVNAMAACLRPMCLLSNELLPHPSTPGPKFAISTATMVGRSASPSSMGPKGNLASRAGKQCLLLTLSAANHALVPSGTYVQSCQAACWAGKRDAPIIESRDETTSNVSLGKRDPVNPDTKGTKECQNTCNDRFTICMALVNGSNGQFGNHGW